MINAIGKKNKGTASSTDSTLSKIFNYLRKLANSTLNVTELAKEINVHRTTVWRNMRKLEIGGLIRTKRVKNGVYIEMLHHEYNDAVEKIKVVARNKIGNKEVSSSNVASRISNRFEMLHPKNVNKRDVACKNRLRERRNETSKNLAMTGLDSNVASDVARQELYNNLYIPTKIPKLHSVHSDILVGNRETDKTCQPSPTILASMLHVRENTSKGRQICSWIRNWVDLSAYLIANGVTTYRENSSGETPCHCPFHDDRKPSFFANRSKGIWYCHACDIEGDAVEFVERRYGLRWGDAFRKVIRDIRQMLENGNTDILTASGERIAEALEDWKAIMGEHEKSLNKRAFIKRHRKEERHKDNLSLRSNKTSKTNVKAKRKLLEVASITKADQLTSNYMNFTKQATEYIKKRGIKADTAFYFGLGFDKKNDALVLPVRDIQGKIVGRAYRSIMSAAKGFNKGFCKNENLFGLFEVAERAKKQGKIYVVEGYIDALLLFQEGMAAVAIGGTKLSEAQVELLASVLGDQVQVIVVPDNDKAGKKGLKKSLTTLSNYFINLAINRVKKGFKDVAEYLCKKKLQTTY